MAKGLKALLTGLALKNLRTVAPFVDFEGSRFGDLVHRVHCTGAGGIAQTGFPYSRERASTQCPESKLRNWYERRSWHRSRTFRVRGHVRRHHPAESRPRTGRRNGLRGLTVNSHGAVESTRTISRARPAWVTCSRSSQNAHPCLERWVSRPPRLGPLEEGSRWVVTDSYPGRYLLVGIEESGETFPAPQPLPLCSMRGLVRTALVTSVRILTRILGSSVESAIPGVRACKTIIVTH